MSSLEESYSLAVKKSIDIAIKYHNFQNTEKEHAVVMYSGGMDSVSLAWNLLKHTNQSIHIHSIHIDNSDNRCQAEAKAIYESINWLKENQRPFEFSSSVYSWKAAHPGGRDMSLALFQSMRVVAGLPHNVVAVYTGDYNMGKEESAEAMGVMNALTTFNRKKPNWAAPLDYMNKVPVQRSLGVYFSMPHQLREMYWSCRKPTETPSGFVTCGVCHACDRQYKLQQEINGN